MIKPFYDMDHNAKIVEVEKYGVINLEEMPIYVDKEKRGVTEINWARDSKGLVLYLSGGTCALDYGGAELGVLKIVEYKEDKPSDF